MPLLTIVVLADQDGDEFPIAIPGATPSPLTDEDATYLYDLAYRRAEKLVEEGRIRPTGSLDPKRIEPTD